MSDIKLPPAVGETSAYLWIERRYSPKVTDKLIFGILLVDRGVRPEMVSAEGDGYIAQMRVTVRRLEAERDALLKLVSVREG